MQCKKLPLISKKFSNAKSSQKCLDWKEPLRIVYSFSFFLVPLLGERTGRQRPINNNNNSKNNNNSNSNAVASSLHSNIVHGVNFINSFKYNCFNKLGSSWSTNLFYSFIVKVSLPKLTPVVSFNNNLRAALAPISWRQKNTKPNCYLRKAAQNTFVWQWCPKMLVKLTPVDNFINILQAAFALADPESTKRLTAWLSFCAFGICTPKSCLYNLYEIDPWSQSYNQYFTSFS